MKYKNRVRSDVLAHRPLGTALAIAFAMAGTGSCSPVAPSLFKDGYFGVGRAPEAGLAPAPDSNHEDSLTGGDESTDENTSVGLSGSLLKAVTYSTVFESIDQADAADSVNTSAGSRLVVTLGDSLLADLVVHAETRFTAALEFVPTKIVAHLHVRDEAEDTGVESLLSAFNGAEEDEVDPQDEWKGVSLELEPLVVADDSGSHWVARLPGATEELLAKLKDRVESIEIEFVGSDETSSPGSEAATANAPIGEITPSPSPSPSAAAAEPSHALIPAADAVKGHVTPLKGKHGVNISVR